MKTCTNIQIKRVLFFFFILFIYNISQAQFLDEFKKDHIEDWFFFTGDGNAGMDFVQKDGYARILIDATKDEHNVWWAIIKRNISPELDLGKLQDPNFELRVEARVRLSDAPRRINFMINTQRTINFHEHLKEYDIADTSDWHIISMTTKNLDVIPGDTLYVQLGVTDWGLETYHVDIDYYRADIVDIDHIEPDKGEPLTYHPPVPDVNTFSHKLNVAHDALIHTDFPGVNFNDWHVNDHERKELLLTTGANQWTVLRWDFSEYKKADADGAALLELTTHSVLSGGDYTSLYGEDLGMEFGKVRIIEIIGGDTEWDQNRVTYTNFLNGSNLSDVINGQMIFDTELSGSMGSKNYITLSRPVIQRLIDGKTKGLLIKPLGGIIASFYPSENPDVHLRPKLYFNIRK